MTTPVQLRAAPVVAVEPAGAYVALTLRAPEVAAAARPGQFVGLAVGGPDSPMVARRCFSLADWDAETVRVVFAVTGRGTAWLRDRRPGDPVDVVGPLGVPFPLPAVPGPVVLVGGGYGAAPLARLASALTAAGGTPALLLGAATAARLLVPDPAPAPVTVTTEDGSAGARGRVTDALAALLATGAETVYACGPMPMLAAVAALAAAHRLPAYVAVEEAMACGVGVCMTCVLPVVGDDGRTRMVRSCVEGPVFPADRVRFDAVGTVPADAVGAA